MKMETLLFENKEIRVTRAVGGSLHVQLQEHPDVAIHMIHSIDRITAFTTPSGGKECECRTTIEGNIINLTVCTPGAPRRPRAKK